MDALFQELGVTNIDDAIAILKSADLHCEVVESNPMCCCAVELPLPDETTLPTKRTTRFSDDVRVQEFVSKSYLCWNPTFRDTEKAKVQPGLICSVLCTS